MLPQNGCNLLLHPSNDCYLLWYLYSFPIPRTNVREFSYVHQQLCWKDHKNALILAFAQVDYLYNEETGTWKTLHQEQHVKNNLALLLQWSPFSTEAELLKQVRMNLWNCFPSFSVIFFSVPLHTFKTLGEYHILYYFCDSTMMLSGSRYFLWNHT